MSTSELSEAARTDWTKKDGTVRLNSAFIVLSKKKNSAFM